MGRYILVCSDNAAVYLFPVLFFFLNRSDNSWWNWKDKKSVALLKGKQMLGSLFSVSFRVEVTTGIRVAGIWRLPWLHRGEATLSPPQHVV